MNSALLGCRIKVNSETGEVKVDDKKKFGPKGYVSYSREEIAVLAELQEEITPTIERVKNIFDGVIVRGSSENNQHKTETD